MTDAYRTSPNTCPTCASPLREFAKRLVCDACGGLMLGEDDFAQAVEDTAGRPLPITHTELSQSPTACPRCRVRMGVCTLVVGKKALKTTFLRCPEHGLWCAPDVLPAVFAVLGRAFSGAVASRGAGSRTGLDGLPVPQHRAASGGLAISAWHHKRRKRTQTVPVDSYRDQALACPACTGETLRFASDRWICAGCHGAFVQAAALTALVEEMSGQPYELAAATGAPGERACPVCSDAMCEERLASVSIDRCTEHGVWFDQHELQTALIEVGVPEKSGLVGWLKRLF